MDSPACGKPLHPSSFAKLLWSFLLFLVRLSLPPLFYPYRHNDRRYRRDNGGMSQFERQSARAGKPSNNGKLLPPRGKAGRRGFEEEDQDRRAPEPRCGLCGTVSEDQSFPVRDENAHSREGLGDQGHTSRPRSSTNSGETAGPATIVRRRTRSCTPTGRRTGTTGAAGVEGVSPSVVMGGQGRAGPGPRRANSVQASPVRPDYNRNPSWIETRGVGWPGREGSEWRAGIRGGACKDPLGRTGPDQTRSIDPGGGKGAILRVHQARLAPFRHFGQAALIDPLIQERLPDSPHSARRECSIGARLESSETGRGHGLTSSVGCATRSGFMVHSRRTTPTHQFGAGFLGWQARRPGRSEGQRTDAAAVHRSAGQGLAWGNVFVAPKQGTEILFRPMESAPAGDCWQGSLRWPTSWARCCHMSLGETIVVLSVYVFQHRFSDRSHAAIWLKGPTPSQLD